MAEKYASGSANDTVPYASLSDPGSVIDVSLADTEPKRNVTTAIRCDGACVLSVKMSNGKTRSVAFAAGETRALQVAQVLAVTTGTPWPLELIF